MASNSILASMAVALTANVSDFNRGIAAAKKELAGFKKAGEEMKGVGENLTKYLSAPLAGLAAVSLKTFGDIQALQKGLESVTGSAEGAAKRFDELQSATKGLDLTTVAQADVSLQASGVAADKSLKSIQEFGNALKTVGKGSASDLKGALYGVQQLAATEFPMAEDLNIIKEAVPQVGKVLKEAFGTARSEELKKLNVSSAQVLDTILNGLGKLPRVSGGINNSFTGVLTNVQKGLSTLGDAINKTFNVEGLLSGFSKSIGNLATDFSKLSTPVQGSIIVVAGLAAAIGPLVLGLGALSAAIPTIAAGFAILTGPIGLIVTALTALTVAGVAWYQSAKKLSDGAVKGWQEQSNKVKTLEKDFVPLVNRYEELSAKTKLSKAEQNELSAALEQISKVAPSAVTEFDKYGKALGVSTQKAREFVQLQREILAVKNKEGIDEQIANLKRLDAEIGRINFILEKGFRTKVIHDEFTTITREIKLTENEAINLRAKLEELGSTRRGTQGILNDLRGITNTIKEMPQLPAPPKIPGQDTYEKIKEDLRLASLEYQVFGDAADYANARLSILKNGIGKLLSEGLSPQSELVQKLTGQYNNLSKSVKDYGSRIKELPKLTAPDLNSIFAEPILRDGLSLKVNLLPVDTSSFQASLTQAEQIIANFSSNAAQLINNFVTDSFVKLGEAIGSAIAGNGAQGFFDSFLLMLTDFAGQFGKLLISVALAEAGLVESLKNPATWPIALAAGVALTAAAGAAKSFLSKGMGSGVSAPKSSSPNYGNPGTGNDYGNKSVEFMIKGEDLVGIMGRRSYRTYRFGG